MSIVLAILSRNLRLFFRDRMNVFFSLLSGLILFFLYTLFLARLQVDGLATTLPDATEAQITAFVDSWMLSGIVPTMISAWQYPNLSAQPSMITSGFR